MSPWIKMRTNLADDPKVRLIAKIVKTNATHVIGGLYVIWALADEYSVSGRLDGYDIEEVDGRFGKEGFCRAMEHVGWLEIGDDYISVQRFGKHNGESAKARADSSNRVRQWRKLSKQKCYEELLQSNVKKKKQALTKSFRREIFDRDDSTCAYCGYRPEIGQIIHRRDDLLSVDHIIPESLGGPTDRVNCVTACMACNKKKTKLIPSVYGGFPAYLTEEAKKEIMVTDSVTETRYIVVAKALLEEEEEKNRINTSNDVLTATGSGGADTTKPKAPAKAKADAKPEHGEFIAAWGKAWSGKYGKPYAVANHAKENTHVKQILDAVDRDPKEATLLAARYLADDDPFVADKCHPIALLVTRVNQYRGVKTHPAIFHPTEDDPIWDELARNLQNDNWVDPKTARERWTKANSPVSDQATMP